MVNSDYYGRGAHGGMDHFNWPDPPECLKCYAELEPDWKYCPFCGEEIDWDGVEDESGTGW